MFRGREVTHPERGTALLDKLAGELAEIAVIEQSPLQDGRNMTMMLAPSKSVLAAGSHTRRRTPGRQAARRETARHDASPRADLDPADRAPEAHDEAPERELDGRAARERRDDRGRTRTRRRRPGLKRPRGSRAACGTVRTRVCFTLDCQCRR